METVQSLFDTTRRLVEHAAAYFIYLFEISKPVRDGFIFVLYPGIYMMHRMVFMLQLLLELGMDTIHILLLLPCRLLGKFEVMKYSPPSIVPFFFFFFL